MYAYDNTQDSSNIKNQKTPSSILYDCGGSTGGIRRHDDARHTVTQFTPLTHLEKHLHPRIHARFWKALFLTRGEPQLGMVQMVLVLHRY